MSEQKSGQTAKKRGHPPWFFFRRRGLEGEIETIHRYIETVTSALDREFASFEERLRQQAEGADEETRQLLGEDYAEEKGYLIDHFPEFTLQNTFVATYSLLEDEMFKIARFVGGRLKIKLDPEELCDKGIRAAKKFLEKLCDITIPGDAVWQQAVQHGSVRNVFAHARGRVKKTSTDVRRYVEGKTSSIDDKDQLHVTKEFCFEVLDNVKALLLKVLYLAGDRVARIP
jgi:hypothetical protein